MRKLLATVSAIAVAASIAGGIVYAANLSLFSGASCAESSQTVACLNQLVQAVNAGVTGNLAFTPGPVAGTTGSPTTANNTLASATIATGQLLVAGQGLRVRCSGIQASATTNARVGIVVGRSMAVSLEAIPGANPNWDMEVQLHAATTPVTANEVWVGRGFASNASGNATNFMAVNGGNDTTVTDNNVNFSLPVSCVQYAGVGGIATGSVTMENFLIEVLR